MQCVRSLFLGLFVMSTIACEPYETADSSGSGGKNPAQRRDGLRGGINRRKANDSGGINPFFGISSGAHRLAFSYRASGMGF